VQSQVLTKSFTLWVFKSYRELKLERQGRRRVGQLTLMHFFMESLPGALMIKK
jgi:hypothetical protein